MDDASDGMSSSVSEDCVTTSEGRDGKQNVGRVGMDTGSVGLVERRFGRLGKVGEMGEDCGLRRRTKLEIGVFAMRSASRVSFLSTRRLSPLVDGGCVRPRNGEVERGEVESAYTSQLASKEQ